MIKNRLLAVLAGAVALVIAGCGTEPQVCTAIGAPTGVALEVVGSLAQELSDAMVQVCWEGDCHSAQVELMPSTAAVPQDCTGTGPDDSCSAELAPTGAKHGFVDLTDLPESEVEVTVILRSESGEPVFQDSVALTPQRTYPNGPDCGGQGVQASVIAKDSALRAAP